jgi:hypothetical protein
MTTFTQLTLTSSDPPGPFTDRLRLAVAAYLARFKGSSREHAESDLRCYLSWCAGQGPDPLAARRPHLELYIRSMQEIRRFKPSTVSRRYGTTEPARTWTATRTTSSPPSWPLAPDPACVSRIQAPGDALHCRCDQSPPVSDKVVSEYGCAEAVVCSLRRSSAVPANVHAFLVSGGSSTPAVDRDLHV